MPPFGQNDTPVPATTEKDDNSAGKKNEELPGGDVTRGFPVDYYYVYGWENIRFIGDIHTYETEKNSSRSRGGNSSSNTSDDAVIEQCKQDWQYVKSKDGKTLIVYPSFESVGNNEKYSGILGLVADPELKTNSMYKNEENPTTITTKSETHEIPTCSNNIYLVAAEGNVDDWNTFLIKSSGIKNDEGDKTFTNKEVIEQVTGNNDFYDQDKFAVNASGITTNDGMLNNFLGCLKELYLDEKLGPRPFAGYSQIPDTYYVKSGKKEVVKRSKWQDLVLYNQTNEIVICLGACFAQMQRKILQVDNESTTLEKLKYVQDAVTTFLNNLPKEEEKAIAAEEAKKEAEAKTMAETKKFFDDKGITQIREVGFERDKVRYVRKGNELIIYPSFEGRRVSYEDVVNHLYKIKYHSLTRSCYGTGRTKFPSDYTYTDVSKIQQGFLETIQEAYRNNLVDTWDTFLERKITFTEDENERCQTCAQIIADTAETWSESVKESEAKAEAEQQERIAAEQKAKADAADKASDENTDHKRVDDTSSTERMDKMIETARNELRKMKNIWCFAPTNKNDITYQITNKKTEKLEPKTVTFKEASATFDNVWLGTADYTKDQLNDALMYAISVINNTTNLTYPGKISGTTRTKYKELYDEIFTVAHEEKSNESLDPRHPTVGHDYITQRLNKFFKENKIKGKEPKNVHARLKRKLKGLRIPYVTTAIANAPHEINKKNAKTELNKIFKSDTTHDEYKPISAVGVIFYGTTKYADAEEIIKKYYIPALRKFGKQNEKNDNVTSVVRKIEDGLKGELNIAVARKRDRFKNLFKRGKA